MHRKLLKLRLVTESSHSSNTQELNRDFSAEGCDPTSHTINKQDLVHDVGRHGGRRTGQLGRPVGSRNKRTQELLDAVMSTGITPVDYLLSVMRDTDNEQSVRVEAAKALLPYLHAKLHSVEVSTLSKPLPLASVEVPIDAHEAVVLYKKLMG